MVEPGTAGWQDFADVRARVVNRSRTRVLVMVNILRSGMGTGKENDPAEMDPEGAAKIARANPDVIVGFKTAHYEPADWHAVDNLVKAGARNDGTRRLVCELTLRAGRVVWDLNGRAGVHWKSFNYGGRSRTR